MQKLSNFINNEFMDSALGNDLENICPSTGEAYSLIPDSTEDDINAAVECAARAFPAWAATPRQERSRLLYNIADLLEQKLLDFAIAESRDQGKPLKLATSLDIPRSVANFRFFAGAILHAEERAYDMDGGALNYTLRSPLGVVGLITPWNLPLYLLTWKIAPALAAGNTVVCKPSELTPMTAWLLAYVLKEAGLPAGVCNIVFGRGETAGKSLVAHPNVRAVSFTGGTSTGVEVIRNAAPTFKKVSLELGGKNPTLLFDDANLAESMPVIVKSAFLNQGEICLCGSRIFVHEKIAEKFTEEFVKKTQDLVTGDPFSESTDVGALVSEEHRNKVEEYVALAKQEGGVILTGGRRPELRGTLRNGYWLLPCVVANLSAQSRVAQEEVFGPLVTIHTFRDEDEVLAQANGTRYGLSASVFTKDLSRAHRVARKLEAGTVWINSWLVRDLRVPFGGVKASGVGREGGEHSLDFYTEQKTVCLKLGDSNG